MLNYLYAITKENNNKNTAVKPVLVIKFFEQNITLLYYNYYTTL